MQLHLVNYSENGGGIVVCTITNCTRIDKLLYIFQYEDYHPLLYSSVYKNSSYPEPISLGLLHLPYHPIMNTPNDIMNNFCEYFVFFEFIINILPIYPILLWQCFYKCNNQINYLLDTFGTKNSLSFFNWHFWLSLES